MTVPTEHTRKFSTTELDQNRRNAHTGRNRSFLQIVSIVIMAIGLGIFLGILFSKSQTAQQTIIAVLVFSLLAILIVRKPLYGLLVWIFLMPFVETWVSISAGAGIPDLSFSRFIVIVLAATLVARALNGRFHFLALSVTDLLVIAIPLLLVVAAPMSIDPRGTIQQSLSIFFISLAGYFFARHLVRGEKDLHLVFIVIALFGLIAGAYAIYEQLTGNVLFLAQGQKLTQYYRGDTDIRLVQGLLNGTGSMGRVLAVTTLISVYLYVQAKGAHLRLFILGAIVVQLVGLLATFSRTPILALLLSLLLLQFFYPQFRKIFLVGVVAGLLVLSLGWEQFSDSDIVEDRIGERAEDWSGRTQRWQTAYAMWLEKPIFGQGYGRFEEDSGTYRTDDRRKNLRAVESDYLYILLGSGLVGLLPYLAFLLIPFVKSLKLFARVRRLDSPSFITPAAIAMYWAIFLSFIIFSVTARQTNAVVKLIPFVIFGAVIGTHEHLIRSRGDRSIEATGENMQEPQH